jgi:hypothetical protein
MRKGNLCFAAALVCLVLPPTMARGETPSCPIGTSVFPLTFLTLPRYDVQATDGGPGDLDETIDGDCELALTACLGTPVCPAEPIERVRVSVRGKPSNLSPHEISEELLAAFAGLSGAEPIYNGVDLSGAGPAPEICAQVRVGISTATRSDHNVSVRVTARSARRVTSTRVKLRCAPADARTTNALACVTTDGLWCPIEADEPGAPPPGVPVVTTTTTSTSTTSTFFEEDPTTSTTTAPEEPTTTSTAPEEPTTTTSTGPEEPPATTSTTTPTTTPSSTTLPPSGRTYFISPAGDDDDAGTSRSTPFKSFDHAIDRLEPGDLLVVMDGTYKRGTTGLPRIHCGSNAKSGTSSAPITIRAENERRAFLDSDGYQAGFEMMNCKWWRVEGLRAASEDNADGNPSDGYPFRFSEIENVTLRRLLGSHNNRPHNTHVYAIEYSQNVLVEECEAYFFHRHAFSLWKSYGIVLRRCYANSMRYGQKDCCSDVDNRDFGDEAYSVYGTSASVLENCVSENEANGFQIHGIANPLDPSGHGGRNNQILGSLSVDDTISGLVSSRETDGDYHNALGNLFRDFVAIETQGTGLYLRGAAGTVVENSTLFGSRGGSGLLADGGASGLGGTCGSGNPQGCGFTARNVLALDNNTYGIATEDQDTWSIEYSNAVGSEADWGVGESVGDTSGHVQRSDDIDPGAMGRGEGQCLLWVPAGSPMKGAGTDGQDIGANIVYRYENGRLTDIPLWDRSTGAFPCGAIVEGINDGDRACSNLHRRVNANTNGCPLP